MLYGENEKARLTITLNKKLSAGNTILRANSCHPKHKILAIPTGEYTRAGRVCTIDRDCDQEWYHINGRWRGYHEWMLKTVENRVKNTTQQMPLPNKNEKWGINYEKSNVFSTAYRIIFQQIIKSDV